jgi:hypothetical protein
MILVLGAGKRNAHGFIGPERTDIETTFRAPVLRRVEIVVAVIGAAGFSQKPVAFAKVTVKFRPMIADEIKDLMQAQPFRPVRIVLGNRRSFVVVHTDYLMISPDRQSIHFYDQGGHFKIINVQQIKLVEPVKGRRSKAA